MGGVVCSEACCQEAQMDKGMEDRVASMVQLEAGDSLVSPEPRKEDLRPMSFNKASPAITTPTASAPTSTTAHAVPTMLEPAAVETIPEGDGKHVHLKADAEVEAKAADPPEAAKEEAPAAAAAAEEEKKEELVQQEEPAASAPEKQEAPPVIAPKKQTIQRKHTGFVNDEKAQEIQAKKGCCAIS
mmetsp:Transcript_72883/g.152173  ORF Transcript_72883/g.152173 Transcript_72883/m.152173 type:complete len:186 (+) Transcript_72883:298-855(+)